MFDNEGCPSSGFYLNTIKIGGVGPSSNNSGQDNCQESNQPDRKQIFLYLVYEIEIKTIRPPATIDFKTKEERR